MRRIWIVFLGLPLMVWAGPQQMAFMQKLNSGKPSMQCGQDTIRFALHGHKIYVKAQIGDSRALNFIVDTGALTIVDEAVALELSLKRGVAMPALDTLKSAYVAAEGLSFGLGRSRVDAFIPMITDLPDAMPDEPSLDGFIGSDFLRFFVVTLDYQNQWLILSSTPPVDSKQGVRLPLQRSFPLGFPMIEGTLDGNHTSTMMIDTGSPFFFVGPLTMVEKEGLFDDYLVLKSQGMFMKWPSTTATYNYLALAQTLRFGDLDLRQVPLYFAELPGMLTSPLLGKDFLEHFVMTLDFVHGEVIWVPQEPSLDCTLSSVGFGITKQGNRCLVKGVWPGSPAEKQGLRVGDQILWVNGNETAGLSSREIEALLDQGPGGTVTLRVKRGQDTWSLSLISVNFLER